GDLRDLALDFDALLLLRPEDLLAEAPDVLLGRRQALGIGVQSRLTLPRLDEIVIERAGRGLESRVALRARTDHEAVADHVPDEEGAPGDEGQTQVLPGTGGDRHGFSSPPSSPSVASPSFSSGVSAFESSFFSSSFSSFFSSSFSRAGRGRAIDPGGWNPGW